MRVSQKYTAVFDDPNLVSCAGLAPVLTLAERAGLRELLDQRVTMRGRGTANAGVKLTALVAGMVAGADSIDDMDVLRHGATGRLIVRRVRRLNPSNRHAGAEQGELLPAWHYHAVSTNSPLRMLDAEAAHRGHAIIEQVIAELKDGPLAHLPSGKFNANAAWLVLASIALNLTRAAGSLASRFQARARLATLRAPLINVPGRPGHSARPLILHPPQHWRWRWQHAWHNLDQRARGASTTATR